MLFHCTKYINEFKENKGEHVLPLSRRNMLSQMHSEQVKEGKYLVRMSTNL